jgi:26S proteasome regulatory subunit N1
MTTTKDKKKDSTEVKKGDLAPAPLSEEDEQKKNDLELLVQRLSEGDEGVQKLALEQLRTELQDSTSTVTSIPKPLKFLRPHYGTLKDIYQRMKPSDTKTLFANLLSVMAMTMGAEDERESLKFILQGNVDEFENWGHEYVSNLSGEIGNEYQHRIQVNPDLTDDQIIDLLTLINKIVPYFMKNNAEPEACDLLLETEKLEQIIDYCDNINYQKVCQYLNSVSKYSIEPENIQIQKNSVQHLL